MPVSPSKDIAILTPYVIPKHMPHKAVNLGDGFILHGIERLLGAFDPDLVLSNRIRPEAAIREANRIIVLGGANQLSDDFSPWPGLTAREILNGGLRFLPMGVGLHGGKSRNLAFTAQAREIIEAIHDRIEYSSWRCPRTVAILEAGFPNLRKKFLMTGCPVLYDQPLLSGRNFLSEKNSIAVTVTDRGDFYDREAGTLEVVARIFASSSKQLVFHQDFQAKDATLYAALRDHLPAALIKKRDQFRRLAKKLGYEIVVPKTAAECLQFYRQIDMHIGSRLHAHLHFLSQNKKSFLTYVDDRCLGFSEFLGFPLVEPWEVKHLDFDFEIVRRQAKHSFAAMRVFLKSLKKLSTHNKNAE